MHIYIIVIKHSSHWTQASVLRFSRLVLSIIFDEGKSIEGSSDDVVKTVDVDNDGDDEPRWLDLPSDVHIDKHAKLIVDEDINLASPLLTEALADNPKTNGFSFYKEKPMQKEAIQDTADKTDMDEDFDIANADFGNYSWNEESAHI